MFENSRELKSKLAIVIFISVFSFIAIYLLVMYFINSDTRSDSINLSAATFQLNNRTYSAYCELNELLEDKLIIADNAILEKRLRSQDTATLDVTLKSTASDSHEHILQITVKNVFDSSVPVKDAIVCKISIDINSINPNCNIKFFDTSITSLIQETTSQEWTDRLGQPTMSGSFETKKYSWIKQIEGFDATLVLVREFGNTKHLYLEIQNVESLFQS